MNSSAESVLVFLTVAFANGLAPAFTTVLFAARLLRSEANPPRMRWWVRLTVALPIFLCLLAAALFSGFVIREYPEHSQLTGAAFLIGAVYGIGIAWRVFVRRNG